MDSDCEELADVGADLEAMFEFELGVDSEDGFNLKLEQSAKEAYTDDVDGKLRTEIATSIREADSERGELPGALKCS